MRGEGGYIIVAPSVSIGDGTPKNVAGEYRAELEGCWLFATAPDWLYELIQRKPEPAPQPKRDSKSFWRNVNDLALQNLDAWVPVVFGSIASYQPGTGAWRVSSEALGHSRRTCRSTTHPCGHMRTRLRFQAYRILKEDFSSLSTYAGNRTRVRTRPQLTQKGL